jgi:hypothetical protein
MKKNFLWAGLLALAIGGVQAGEFYRWVDSSGKVHYGDQPPTTEGAQVEHKKFSSAPEDDDADLPYETRRAHENFPVTLYTSSNCKEPCTQGRDLLNKRGIPFTEKSLVTQEDVDSFKKLTGSGMTPTLAVGKSYLNGFEAGQWSSELDTAGYPKVAPYRSKKAAKPSPDKPKTEQ